MWNQRYLTPIGKVAVIKTLALSKLNHLFLALPNSKKELLKKIENMFYKIIWNGKPDKIRRQFLANLYLEGGLNMIDITHFISALKITWVRRLYVNAETPWASLAKHYLGMINKMVLLGSNYAESLVKQSNNKFWADVGDSLSNLSKNIQIKNSTDAMSEPMWHNPKISKAALYFPIWSGIISVADMFTENRELLSQKDLEQSYSIKTNYLEYHRVKSCMKVYLSKLKLDLTDQQKPVYPNQIKVLCNSNKGSQDFYWLLNYQCLDKNAPFLSWKNSLNLTIAENTWRHIFQICFKTVKDNDLIWLQLRILYKILGTNDLLLKINKHGSGKCNFLMNNLKLLHICLWNAKLSNSFGSYSKPELNWYYRPILMSIHLV